MTNSIQRDLKRRKLFSKYELKRLQLKNIINDLNIPKEIRYNCILELNKLPKNSSQTRLKNRCIITGRGKSISNFCRLSRIKLRELASQGLVMGVIKSSW